MKKKSLIISSVVIFAVAILLNTGIAFNVNGESSLSLKQLQASADSEIVTYEIVFPDRVIYIDCDEQHYELCYTVHLANGSKWNLVGTRIYIA